MVTVCPVKLVPSRVPDALAIVSVKVIGPALAATQHNVEKAAILAQATILPLN
jgi:hypothetical protein